MTLLFLNGVLLSELDYTLDEQNNSVTFPMNVEQNWIIQVLKLDGLASSRKTVNLDSDFSAGSPVPL